MGPGPTEHVELVDNIMLYITGISVILLLGITFTMIYFVVKYNRKKGHKPVDIHGSVTLEVIWILVPTILVMTMFYYGFVGYKEFQRFPDDSMEISVVGRMWKWDFTYENGKTSDTLYVPINKPIKLIMESVDVNHSFYIPAFRIKRDVLPNKVNFMGFTPTEEGRFDVACAEYCGLNHSKMYTDLIVLNEEKFNEWVKVDSLSNK